MRLEFDHVELFVPDRQSAADWYAELFGMQVIEEFRDWAEDPQGPLMMGFRDQDSQHTGEARANAPSPSFKLAIFAGERRTAQTSSGFQLLALRCAGVEFARLSKSLVESHQLEIEIKDHDQALSFYFSDPWGNCLEITTYDHVAARKILSDL